MQPLPFYSPFSTKNYGNGRHATTFENNERPGNTWILASNHTHQNPDGETLLVAGSIPVRGTL